MQQHGATIRAIIRAGRLPGALLLSALLSLLIFSPARAQETLVRVQIEGAQPVEAGDQFQASVIVENVEHLAGFDFTIGYDPERVAPIETEESGDTPLPEGVIAIEAADLGQFVEQNGERQDIICDAAKADVEDSTATVSCVTVGPPLCLGGSPGASGTGVLGRVVFESKGGDMPTTLELVNSTLVLDDIADCDPENPPQRIEHQRQDATVELSGSAGGGGGSTVAIVVGIVVAVVVVAGGAAGVVWYRRRGASST